MIEIAGYRLLEASPEIRVLNLAAGAPRYRNPQSTQL
jgi:hypothetical protein